MSVRILPVFLAMVLLPLAPVVQSEEAVIEGVWRLTVSTPRGIQHPILTIVKGDAGYSGTLVGRRGEQQIDAITVEGNTFAFPLTVKMPFATMDMTYSAAVDGDRFAGEIGNPRGTIPFEGERVVESGN